MQIPKWIARSCWAINIRLGPIISKSRELPARLVVGDREVNVVDGYSGTEPLSRPTQVIVYDFDVPTKVTALDHSGLREGIQAITAFDRVRI